MGIKFKLACWEALEDLYFSLRLPVELGGAQSLIPLHSATASALFTSLLSLHNTSWGCLSEGTFRNFTLVFIQWIMQVSYVFECHCILSFIISENP